MMRTILEEEIDEDFPFAIPLFGDNKEAVGLAEEEGLDACQDRGQLGEQEDALLGGVGVRLVVGDAGGGGGGADAGGQGDEAEGEDLCRQELGPEHLSLQALWHPNMWFNPHGHGHLLGAIQVPERRRKRQGKKSKDPGRKGERRRGKG
ncbi:Major viral transcription factor ICP4-like protein [Frankliniella fusca]|uniref:Major viral transcription factor ICP4-like protein n=1 Tax=Frankliniella fusca TaxID=407009 RepID=A0AAE1IZ19_9NEOP|nr:Major viral transcription factor ICP4-like protein [Frankliniella fusca]